MERFCSLGFIPWNFWQLSLAPFPREPLGAAQEGALQRALPWRHETPGPLVETALTVFLTALSRTTDGLAALGRWEEGLDYEPWLWWPAAPAPSSQRWSGYRWECTRWWYGGFGERVAGTAEEFPGLPTNTSTASAATSSPNGATHAFAFLHLSTNNFANFQLFQDWD